MRVSEAARVSGAGRARRRGDAATKAEGGNARAGPRRGCGEEEEEEGREVRVRSWRKGAKRTRGLDSGPVINEESNFQAGDLTSSRPTVAATQCEMERKKVVQEGAVEGFARKSERDEVYCE